MTDKQFEPGSYWARRVDKSAGLDVVGHRSLGKQYNHYIYRRRAEVLADCLHSLGLQVETLRILDIGCGCGFYTQFWKSIGAKYYVGIDISADAVERLSEEYPDYEFVCMDATQPNISQNLTDKFDLITVFDVLYHVIDDGRAGTLLMNVSDCLGENAHAVIFDQLLERDCSLTPHVKLRSRKTYNNLLASAGLAVCFRRKLFQLLAPPVFGNKVVDIGIAGVYKIAGLLMKSIGRIGDVVGRAIYHLDLFLLRKGLDLPNHEVLAVKKSRQA